MRIVIDLQGAQGASRHRGIGRYSLQFALAVARNRNEHEVIIALNGLFPDTIGALRRAFEDVLPHGSVRVWHGVGPAAGNSVADRHRRETNKLLRAGFIDSLEPDIVHITSLFEGFGDDAVHTVPSTRSYLVSSTFYDLIPLNNPRTYLDANPLYKDFYLNIVADLLEVDLHLAISKFSRLELMRSLDISSSRIHTVYGGVDKCFRNGQDNSPSGSCKPSFNVKKPFILYVSAFDERKNHLRLIEAFSRSAYRTTMQLLLVGHIEAVQFESIANHVSRLGLSDSVVTTNAVSDEELVELYSQCTLFVFPAWQEGLGLPLFEAMSCGALVIGANTSSIPEIINDPRALFNPFDVASIQSCMDYAIGNAAVLEEMRNDGQVRAAAFTWDRVGTEALRCFERKHTLAKDVLQPHNTAPGKSYGEIGSSIGIRTETLKSIISYFSDRRSFTGLSVGLDSRPSNPPLRNSELRRISESLARNHPIQEASQLFIDISELVHRDARTGIQRVVRSVLYELMTQITYKYKGFIIEPVYANLSEPGYRYARAFCAKTFGGLYTPFPDDCVDFKSGDIFVGVDLQHHVVLTQGETYENWRRDGVSVYFIVYDLLPILMPRMFPEGTADLHERWLAAVSAFDGLICISRSVADELATLLYTRNIARKDLINIGWFHLGGDVMKSMPTLGSMPTSNSSDLFEAGATFLMVGTLEPRKGHAQTVAAFEKLWASGIEVNLVIVGQEGWHVADLIGAITSSSHFGKRLIWLSSVSDEALEALYASADCLIAASEGEGFGLPLVEAAQHGLRIFARSLPVFKEVAGSGAFYFTGFSADSMAQAIEVWLGLFARDAAPRSNKIKWMTWKQSVDELFTIIFNRQWYTRLGAWTENVPTLPEPVFGKCSPRLAADQPIEPISLVHKCGTEEIELSYLVIAERNSDRCDSPSNSQPVRNDEQIAKIAKALLSVPSWWAWKPTNWTHGTAKRLQQLGLFDGPAYLRRYPDVEQEGMDPLNHFFEHGRNEGRII
jgi:glycosyltransferase involved in cell wall biosynthesis